MITRHRGWTALAFVAVACSAPPSFVGPASDASVDASSGPSILAACTALAMAECAELETCSSLLMQTRYGSVATCQTRTAENCSTGLVAPATGNTARQVQACAEAYPTWSCDDFLGNVNLPAACAQRTGALANGASCAFPAQCTTGFCAIPPYSACGICAAEPRAGDSCSDLSNCGQRLLCLSASKVCGTLGLVDDACSVGAPCGAHLSCIGDDSAKGTLGHCQASAASTGAACDPTLTKGPGCDYDLDLTCNSQSKKCEPVTISAGGGPCNADNHQFAACAASGTCSTNEPGAIGVCTAAAADGEACSTAGGGPVCVPPARCIVMTSGATSGTCQEGDSTACK